jgi:hypothetical protein
MVNNLHRLEVIWKKRRGVENRSLVHAARYITVSPCAGLGFQGSFGFFQEQLMCKELMLSMWFENCGIREEIRTNASGPENGSQLQCVPEQSSRRQLIHAGSQEDYTKDKRCIEDIRKTLNKLRYNSGHL